MVLGSGKSPRSSYASGSATITAPVPRVNLARSWFPSVATHESLFIKVKPKNSAGPWVGVVVLLRDQPAGSWFVQSCPVPFLSLGETNGPSGRLSKSWNNRLTAISRRVSRDSTTESQAARTTAPEFRREFLRAWRDG